MLPEADHVVLAPGRSETFSIGGVGLHLHCARGEKPLVLPNAYRPFRSAQGNRDVEVRVGSTEALETLDGPVVYTRAHHWRARSGERSLAFELFYPPSSEVYCRMRGGPEFSKLELEFGRRNLERLPEDFRRQSDGHLWLPHPFEQLALIPTLARRGGFLVHACGVVVSGKGLVFAGHSGDGKTTLSRLLAKDGFELLSDERVAIRQSDDGTFRVHGTPWAGEGEVVSNGSVPLGGIFLLEKASEHRLVFAPAGELVAELLARSLVPYYLENEVTRILSLVERAALAVPMGALSFSLDTGLAPLLERIVEPVSA